MGLWSRRLHGHVIVPICMAGRSSEGSQCKKEEEKLVEIPKLPIDSYDTLNLTHLRCGLLVPGIFHCLSVTIGTTQNRHKTLVVCSFKFRLRNFNINDRFIDFHFMLALGTAIIVFFWWRAERNIYSLFLVLMLLHIFHP